MLRSSNSKRRADSTVAGGIQGQVDVGRQQGQAGERRLDGGQFQFYSEAQFRGFGEPDVGRPLRSSRKSSQGFDTDDFTGADIDDRLEDHTRLALVDEVLDTPATLLPFAGGGQAGRCSFVTSASEATTKFGSALLVARDGGGDAQPVLFRRGAARRPVGLGAPSGASGDSGGQLVVRPLAPVGAGRAPARIEPRSGPTTRRSSVRAAGVRRG